MKDTIYQARKIKMAERQGFEPWDDIAVSGFRDRPIQPLWHLSVYNSKLKLKIQSLQILNELNRIKETFLFFSLLLASFLSVTGRRQ